MFGVKNDYLLSYEFGNLYCKQLTHLWSNHLSDLTIANSLSSNMKATLLLFGLLAAVLHASPIIRKPLIDLKPALTLPSLQDTEDSPLGDIWSDCCKFHMQLL